MNIYQTCYDLLNTYVFGGTIEPSSNQELIAILVCTIATLFIIAVPFVIVLKVIRWITGV